MDEMKQSSHHDEKFLGKNRMKQTVGENGWRPWKVAVGSFCLAVAVYGPISVIGQFQTYLEKNQIGDSSYTGPQISWAVSMLPFLECLVGNPAGILFDHYGVRVLLPLGCSTYLASLLGLAFSSTYIQIFISFSLGGVAAAFQSVIAFGVIGQWFRKREGLATGLATAGIPIGGITQSLIAQALLSRYGWRTTILTITFVTAVFSVAGIVLVEDKKHCPVIDLERRQTNDKIETKTPKNAEQDPRVFQVSKALRCFSYLNFWLISYIVFSSELVVTIAWGSFPEYAEKAGLADGAYLMVAFHIGEIVGSILLPWLSDGQAIEWASPLGTYLAMHGVSVLTVLVVWLPFGDRSAVILYLVVVLFGFSMGSFLPLETYCISQISSSYRASNGIWFGSVYTIASIATLIGNPIIQVLLQNFPPNTLVTFLGAILGLSSLSLMWLFSRWR